MHSFISRNPIHYLYLSKNLEFGIQENAKQKIQPGILPTKKGGHMNEDNQPPCSLITLEMAMAQTNQATPSNSLRLADEICTTPTALASSGERQPENEKRMI
jgi:hypothetical protein